MREALRGALLSVLFFALLIGGAPSMAVASDSPTSVTSAHHSNTTMTEAERLEWCKANTRAARVGGIAIAAGFLVSFIAPPVGAGMMIFGSVVEIGANYDLIKYGCP